jgi:hypothetical protein
MSYIYKPGHHPWGGSNPPHGIPQMRLGDWIYRSHYTQVIQRSMGGIRYHGNEILYLHVPVGTQRELSYPENTGGCNSVINNPPLS